MTYLTIDPELCKKDGICAAECPMKIISWKKGERPRPYPNTRSLCINCGHCVAVCPHGALNHEHIQVDDCTPVDKNLVLTLPQTEQFLRSRRSIRTFKPDAVAPDTLSELIRLASYAPSGHNTQPVKWRVINGLDLVNEYTAIVVEWMTKQLDENPDMAKLMHLDMLVNAWQHGVNTVTRDAPTLILAQGHKSNPMAPQACTIAMTYLDLAARAFDVATTWCGFFHMAAMVYEPLAIKLGKDEGLRTHAVMMAGYPVYTYHRMPPRNTPGITWA